MNENLQRRIPSHLCLKRITNDLSPEALKKINCKNYFLRSHAKKKPDSFFNLEKKANKAVFPKPALLKYTKTLHLSTIEDFRGAKTLKKLRNLISFTCTPSNESEAVYVIPFLKALPKSLEKLTLSLQQKFLEVEWPSIVKIYKAISRLRNLKTLNPFYQLGEETEEYIEKEFLCMKKKLPRLVKLKEFGFRQEFYGQTGYQKAMGKPHIYPQVTDLALTVSEDLLPNTEKLEQHFVQEKSVKDDDDSTGFQEDFLDLMEEEETLSQQANSEFGMLDLNSTDNAPGPSIIAFERKADKLMREEISPFFRFEVFPNLKSLTLNLDCSHTLSDFVIDGFRNLTKLQDFKLKLEVRPKGTDFFFKAFYQLPKLNSFALEIPFIQPEEWLLLEKFLYSQENLTGFELNLSQARSSLEGYHAQNQYLEKFVASLDQKAHLRALKLNCKFASLQTVSNGLDQIKTHNKIQSLRIEAFDDQYSALNLKGFYSFLERNNQTLSKLELNLPYIMNVEAIEKMLQEISALKKINSLTLQFNSDRLNSLKNFIKYLHGTLRMKKATLEESYLYYKGSFRPNLMTYFKEIQDLEAITLSIGGLEKVKDPAGKKWFGEMFRQLKELKRLKSFCFSMPFDRMDGKSVEEIKWNLAGLKRNISFTVNQTSREEQEDLVSQSDQIVKNVNRRNQINNFVY